ncbi:hypothetical protein BDF14DRAFT_1694354, partial [Spinellus fusiger]
KEVSIKDQYAFCRLHDIELVVKPKGLQEGYPTDIDFDAIEKRVVGFQQEIEDVIHGRIKSSYRDTALKAYEMLGKNKARSSMGVMARFETTLPGYYGSKGAAIILDVLSRLYLHSEQLTYIATAPQQPIEYLQQVLVPEVGFRLIRQDLMRHNNKNKPLDRWILHHGEQLTEKAKVLMEESSSYGSLVYSLEDSTVRSIYDD